MREAMTAVVRVSATLGLVGLSVVVFATVFLGASPRHDDAWILGAVGAFPAFLASGAYALARHCGASSLNKVLSFTVVIFVIAACIAAFPYVGEAADAEAHDFAWIFAAVAFGSGLLALPLQRFIDHRMVGGLGCVAAVLFVFGFAAFGVLRVG